MFPPERCAMVATNMMKRWEDKWWLDQHNHHIGTYIVTLCFNPITMGVAGAPPLGQSTRLQVKIQAWDLSVKNNFHIFKVM
jgi:hypothetical protein